MVRYVFNENTRLNLQRSFESIKYTIANLEHTSYTVDTLMMSEKVRLASIIANIESITANVADNNAEITTIIKNFSNISDSLAKADVLSIIEDAESVVTRVDAVMQKIDNGEGTLGMLVHNDTLYTNLENVTYNLNRLIVDLRANPKRYLSAFDLGRTVYVVEPEEKEKKGSRKNKRNKVKLNGN